MCCRVRGGGFLGLGLRVACLVRRTSCACCLWPRVFLSICDASVACD
jgi:hypothetical protein